MKKSIFFIFSAVIFSLVLFNSSFAEENLEFVSAKENTVIDSSIKAYTLFEENLNKPFQKNSNDDETSAALKKEHSEINSGNGDKFITYIMRKNPNISSDTAKKISNAVIKYSSEFKVDRYIIMAVVQLESNYTPDCKGKDVYGLMQIHKNTAPYLGLDFEDICDIDLNIKAGTSYISKNIEKYPDIRTALAAYSYGDGNIRNGNYTFNYSDRVLDLAANIKSAVPGL